ncbi:unnamed protein product [Paramecium pentaurelia]|uniref:Uncharacterized protein n=1 Tax=Paramecium pentaurelia TaxID=43138 RepID=A0A8S1X0P0_9CILI|nr:unnamed protein product [Paramecium pentaurelia]
MYQNSGLTYHNVDSYIETEGFFCFEQFSRLDLKKKNWEESLNSLTDDLIALKSEYVDLENLEIFIALLEFLEKNIQESEIGSPYYQLRQGMNQTSINNYINDMLENIEKSLTCDSNDYRAIDYPGLLKLEDILSFLKESKFIKSYSQKVDQLLQLQKEKKQQQIKKKK